VLVGVGVALGIALALDPKRGERRRLSDDLVTKRKIDLVSQVVNPVLLVLLLCADMAFLLLHLWNALSPVPNVLFSLRTDGGYSEVFQYIKEYWIAIVLFVVGWRTPAGIYGIWALLFTYLLCDDALMIHETGGRVAARYWNYLPALGLRAQDFGELTVSAVVGSAFLVSIAYSYRRGTHTARDVSKDLALLLGLLVFFGIFVDMVQIAATALPVEGLTIPVKGLAVIEDSGEMITMSLIVGYVVNLLERRTHVPGLLWRSTTRPFVTS
jgi:hypothetical protein